MEADNDPVAVIDALAEHEETLGALYTAYADLYPTEIGRASCRERV